jgi:hypothetical protein
MVIELVNPLLGTDLIKTKFDVSNPDEAAEQLWENISENKIIMDNLPKFMFTLKDNNDKLHHYLVMEEPKTDGTSDYTIQNVTGDNQVPTETKKEFLREVARMKKVIKKTGKKTKKNKKGGRKHRYDDDSSSSSDDGLETVDDYLRYVRRKSYQTPLWYWWYNPTIYRVRTVKSIFTPVFVPSVTPYVQLWIPTSS